MTGNFMDAARDHLVVLLNEQKELLQALLREDGLLRSKEKDGKDRVLSREGAAKYIEILEGEADKASRLEITLAVAGTVKAGKSTAVNAIIGTEVLPNRAHPMTALPTVIRHEPQRFEPDLTINNAVALDGLAARIVCKLQDEARLKAVRKDHNVNMEALIDDLANGELPVFDTKYEGRARVFEALGRINDLLRLGRHEKVDEELAIEEYDDLHEMPALTVHIRCLTDTAQQSGSLALLDLPGFNEAQLSEHLTKVVEEQFEKASAILVVLDSSQLGTEATEELEMLLGAVSRIMQGRIFVMLNKIDARSNAPDAAKEKEYISKNLMKGVVKPEHVYPVSARYAYLASRVLQALDRGNCLPSYEEEPWVDDFRQDAFGRDKSKLEDLDAVRTAAADLWNDSGFEPLLDNVVIALRRQAPEVALQSTLAKLKWYGNEIENNLNISSGALTEDLAKLEKSVHSMKQSVENMEKAKGDFEKQIDLARNKFDVNIGKILIEANKEVRKNIEIMFNREIEGFIDARQSKQKRGRDAIQEKSDGILRELLRDIFRERDDFEEWRDIAEKFREEGKLEYKNKHDCDKAWEKISEIYKNVAGWFVGNATSSIKDLMRRTHEGLELDLGDRLHNILADARRTLKDGGVEVNLQFPDFDVGDGFGDASASSLARNIETKLSEPRTVVTHRLANFLDPFDLFGWGKKEKRDRVYVIDRGKVIKALEKGLADTLGSYRKHTDAGIMEWKQHADDKFDRIRKYLERYRQSLIDGLADRDMETERMEEFLAIVNGMKKKADDSRANIGDFETAAARALNV